MSRSGAGVVQLKREGDLLPPFVCGRGESGFQAREIAIMDIEYQPLADDFLITVEQQDA